MSAQRWNYSSLLVDKSDERLLGEGGHEVFLEDEKVPLRESGRGRVGIHKLREQGEAQRCGNVNQPHMSEGVQSSEDLQFEAQ